MSANSRGHFIAHFFEIFFALNQKRTSYTNLALVIFFSLFEEIIIFQFGLLTAKFYYILLIKNVAKFYTQLAITFGLILFMAIIKSAKRYVCSVLYIEWREWLSELLIKGYFENRNYYHLNVGGGSLVGGRRVKLDNIDQRLSQDIDKLCSEFSTIIAQLVVSPLTLLYYAYQVNSTIGLFGVIACVAFFLTSTLINRFLVQKIVKWTYLKGKHEGDYRNEHTYVKSYNEKIAFANAEVKVKSKLLQSLSILLSVHENLILQQFYLNFVTTIFDYSGSILSFIIIAVPIFNGAFDHLNEAELSRQISANNFICLYLINCFTKLISITSNFANINGFGYRITELVSAFDQSAREAHSHTTSYANEEAYLRIENVNIVPLHSQRTIIKDLSFEVKPNQNLYISGESGLGKTSILRVIKGLWPISQGGIHSRLDCDNIQQVMFISHNSIFAELFLQVSFSPFFPDQWALICD